MPNPHRVLRKNVRPSRPVLPPILASPICTPTASTSSTFLSIDPGPPAESSPIPIPSWISTPPSPPPATLKRRNRPPSPIHPKPFSLPVSLSKHVTPPSSFLDFPPYSAPAATSPRSLAWLAASEPVSGGSGPRARFHIPLDGSSDQEDDLDEHTLHSTRSDGETTPGGSTTDHSSEENWCKETKKDDARRYHALMELLMTEIGYLRDLRSLVTVGYGSCSYPSIDSLFFRYIFVVFPC
jgi:hypothetical protein